MEENTIDTTQERKSKRTKSIIRFDWAAKQILRNKANFGVLEGLISVLLNEKVTITEILESEGNHDYSDQKFNRVDIMARNHLGEIIIIEIQLTRYLHFLERILFGVGKALTDYIDKGERYEKVKKVYSISILYFDLGEGKDYVYRGQVKFEGLTTGDELQISRRERDTLGIKTPQEVFPVYYLIRVNEFDKEEASNHLEEWVEYLKTGHVRPDTTAPGLREAKEKLDYLTLPEVERRQYDRYLDNLVNEEECLLSAKIEGRAEGREEGLAEGMEKGRAEGLAEGMEKGLAEGMEKGLAEGIEKGLAEGARKKAIASARTMKSMGFALKQIAQITGLSVQDLEEM